MSYSLYTKSFGLQFSNSPVVIREALSGNPAIIMSPIGGVVTSDGSTTLDSLGNLSVVIDTARNWTFTVVDMTPSQSIPLYLSKDSTVGASLTDASGSVLGEIISEIDVTTAAQQSANGAFHSGKWVHISGGPFKVGTPLRISSDGMFVRIPDDSSITVFNNTPISSGIGNQFQNVVYIDPVNGLDTNSGYTPTAPKKTLNEGNSWVAGFASWSTSMCAVFKRGTTYRRNDGTAISISGNQGIGAYGDPSLPKPILNSTYNGANPAVVQIGAPDGAILSDVIVDGSGVLNRHGVFAFSYGTAVFQNLIVSGVDVNNIRQTTNSNPLLNNSWFSGIQVNRSVTTSQNTAFNRASNVRIEACNLSNVGGHGVGIIGGLGVYNSITGSWGGFDISKVSVNDYGQDIDSHGITSYSQLNPGWTGSGSQSWTNVGGSVYSFPFSTQIGQLTPTIDFLTVYVTAAPRTYFLLPYGSTPPSGGWTNLPNGYFGFDPTVSPQVLYVNYGVAINSNLTTGDVFTAACSGPRGIRYIDCTVKGCAPMKLNTQYREGHNFAFDDFVSNSSAIGCKGIGAGGVSFSSNRGFLNTFLFNQLVGGQAGALGLSKGIGHAIEQNLLASGVPVGATVGSRAVCMFNSSYSTWNPTIPQSRLRRNIIHALSGSSAGNIFDGFVGTGNGYYQAPLVLDGNTYTSDAGITMLDLGYGRYVGH